MGQVFLNNQGLLKDFAEEANAAYAEAVINPGQPSSPVSLAAFSAVEAKILLLKLDAFVSQLNNPLIATMVAENAQAIMIAVRMAKEQAKGVFGGILSAGTMLDMRWLRPRDVGGAILNPAAALLSGLYGGVSGTVFSWLQPTVGGVLQHIIPSQTMEQFASVIHLGGIEPVEIPKITDVVFTLGGQPTPPQSAGQNMKTYAGQHYDIQVTRFEKPVIVGPMQSQAIDVMPGAGGNTKFQLLSLICARAQELTTTI